MSEYIKVKDIINIANKTNELWERYGGLHALCIDKSHGFNRLNVAFCYYTSDSSTQDYYLMEISEFFDKSNEKYWDEIQSYFDGYRFNRVVGNYEKGLLVDRVSEYCFDEQKGFPIINFFI